MRQAGAVVSTSESIIFELLEDAKHIHFKEVQNFFKQTREDPMLISKIWDYVSQSIATTDKYSVRSAFFQVLVFY